MNSAQNRDAPQLLFFPPENHTASELSSENTSNGGRCSSRSTGTARPMNTHHALWEFYALFFSTSRSGGLFLHSETHQIYSSLLDSQLKQEIHYRERSHGEMCRTGGRTLLGHTRCCERGDPPLVAYLTPLIGSLACSTIWMQTTTWCPSGLLRQWLTHRRLEEKKLITQVAALYISPLPHTTC